MADFLSIWVETDSVEDAFLLQGRQITVSAQDQDCEDEVGCVTFAAQFEDDTPTRNGLNARVYDEEALRRLYPEQMVEAIHAAVEHLLAAGA